MLVYSIVFIILFIAEIGYFRLAEKFNIVDIPNHRSSHLNTTIRGGGIIWWVASLLYLAFLFSDRSLLFFIGITLIAVVSFVDDIRGMGQKVRLLAHILAISFPFFLTGFLETGTWWMVLIGYVFLIGIVNAFNFMDGINGITGLYSISVLASLQYVNLTFHPFVNPDAIWFPIIASVVFLFFNFRKRARCFAGDIGSVSIAFWIVSLLLMLVVNTRNLIWIGFLAVYGVDTVMTILHRIYLRQNILEPHRLHFYQILVNERKQSHLVVASLYFGTQIIVSAMVICFFSQIGWWILVIVLFVLSGIYMLKFRLMER